MSGETEDVNFPLPITFCSSFTLPIIFPPRVAFLLPLLSGYIPSSKGLDSEQSTVLIVRYITSYHNRLAVKKAIVRALHSAWYWRWRLVLPYKVRLTRMPLDHIGKCTCPTTVRLQVLVCDWRTSIIGVVSQCLVQGHFSKRMTIGILFMSILFCQLCVRHFLWCRTAQRRKQKGPKYNSSVYVLSKLSVELNLCFKMG